MGLHNTETQYVNTKQGNEELSLYGRKHKKTQETTSYCVSNNYPYVAFIHRQCTFCTFLFHKKSKVCGFLTALVHAPALYGQATLGVIGYRSLVNGCPATKGLVS